MSLLHSIQFRGYMSSGLGAANVPPNLVEAQQQRA